MKYYIIAGERSGDLHGSNLIKEIKNLDSETEFKGFGGDMMESAGCKLIQHYRIISFMGFLEVITHLPDIIKTMKKVKEDILSFKPDAVIVIDFAGFNLRIAKFCKENNIPVHYYISPKLWAWNTKRVRKVKKYVDRMYCILPFEKEFYAKHNYKADFVGNPVFDSINNFKPNSKFLADNNLSAKPILAILPGSRRGEVENMLIYMLSLLPSFPDHQFVVAGVTNLPREFYENFEDRANIKIIYEQTYDLLSHADAALVTSGTATLETALFKIPQVVCYKTSLISYIIGKLVVKVPFISLVNLIAGKKVVSELIQDTYNPRVLTQELNYVLSDEGRKQIQEGYDLMHSKLHSGLSASKNTARLIVESVTS